MRDYEAPSMRTLMERFDLTRRQARFVQEYPAQDFCGKDAALEAGYSETSATTRASQLLAKEKIQQALDYVVQRIEEAASHEAEDILRELEAIAFASATDYASWGPEGITLVDSDHLSDRAKAAVKTVKQGKHGLQVKLHDKIKALEDLAEYHNLLTDPGQVRVNIFQVLQSMPRSELKKLADANEEELKDFLDSRAPRMIEAEATDGR